MKYYSLAILLFSCIKAFAQPNCNVFKLSGDTLTYEACEQAMKIKGHYQFSKAYQMILDESLEIDSTFGYAYWAKSIAYLKSGDFVSWKELIDKAVEYSPKEYLGYRGWCRYQFFRDYQGAIADIEQLDSLVDYDIGQSQNGTYHLNIAKGLCYKALGEKEKAIDILERQIKRNEDINFVGTYDYVHLGVLYYETNNLEKAMQTFKKQSENYELAENQYYMALAHRELGKHTEYRFCLKTAKTLYQEGKKLFDTYSNPMDKIYLENIEDEMKAAQNSLSN